jgi:cytochrome bd-type quinol oxidase subunit 1
LSDHEAATRVLSFVIGTVFTTHILTAGLISAAGQLGPILELIGYVRRRPEYDRLAHGMAKFLVLYFAISSAVAFLAVTTLLTGLAGTFWTTIVRIAWWPLVIELFAFLFEIVFAYLWYYTWDLMRGHRPLHITLGGMLLLADVLQVLMINVVASYMLTPEPANDLYHVILNPTFLDLQVHRIVGNIAYVGYLIAAISGFLFLRRRDPLARAFWDWAGSLGMVVGTGMTLMQPLVGYSYAKEIQLHSYDAWYRMMLGPLSTVFLWQITLLGVMFLVAVLYFARRLRSERIRGALMISLSSVVLIVAILLAAQPYDFAFTLQDVQAAGLDRPFWNGGLINPFGAMVPYKIVALTGYTLLTAFALIWYLRGLRHVTWGNAGRGEQRLLVGSVVLVVLMIVTMGIIRENGRSPDLIYGQMNVQEQPASRPSPTPPPHAPQAPIP